jgi:hypothetical protein
MKILPDIEHYLEFIGGAKDANGKTISWFCPTPVIQLASYDTKFIESINEQIQQQTPMSDRQAALAEKLIKNYERQLKKLGIAQPDHKKYRYGQRVVDRSSSLTLSKDEDVLRFKFPFDNKMINDIKLFLKDSQGKVAWNKDTKSWEFAVTEYNVSWVAAYAKMKSICLDKETQELFELITAAEREPYKIELSVENGQCVISNAPDSMLEYIEKNIDSTNLYEMVDNAGVLGYTVSDEIKEIFAQTHSPSFVKLCEQRTIEANPNDTDLTEILEWAKAVGRTPIMVYNPNYTRTTMDAYKNAFGEDQIQIVGTGDPVESVDFTKQLIYTNKILPLPEGMRFPLLITYANLMHGSTKRSLLTQSDKIVYYCETLPKR